MILSGSKSYYDDFVRKKDTSRTLHDPPSLLTDRGAYMNFLEVQLERVSAACLGVQSYDDRFNDMQTLIVSLDKKCASTARMVSISQQCTEQLRNDTEAKLDKLTQHVQAESWEVKRLIEVMSTRIAAVELKAAELPVIHQRLDDDATRTKAIIEDIQRLSEETDSKIHTINCQVKDFEANQESIFQDVESLKTADSKLQFDLTESERKYQNLLDKAAGEHETGIAESEDKMTRNIHIAATKIAGNIETLQVEVASKEAGCLAAVRLLGESLREETLKIKEKLEGHMTGVEEELNTSVENQMKRVNRSLADQIDVINEEIECQKRKISSLNENSRVQFKQLDRTVGSLAKDQEELFHFTNSMNNTGASVMEATEKHQPHGGEDEAKRGGDDESFSSSHAARAAAGGAQRRALQGFRGSHTQSQPFRSQSQQIPSTPSNMLMSSMHEMDSVDGSELKYIGSGLYVDGSIATSPMENIRDSNNNVVSDIKPKNQLVSTKNGDLDELSAAKINVKIQQQATRSSEMKRQQLSNVREVEQDQPRNTQSAGQASQQESVTRAHSTSHGKPRVFEVTNQQQIHPQEHSRVPPNSRGAQHSAPPPPPAAPAAPPTAPAVASPKSKRRAPPAPTTAASSQRQQVSTNASASASAQPSQFLAPVTTGFAHFLKSKGGCQHTHTVDGEESCWKDVLIDRATLDGRPPWMPSSAPATSSLTRKVESQNTNTAHQQQQDSSAQVNSDDRTATSTISDLHSHIAVLENADKMLPERRHYDSSAHLKGASAHL
jgi:hypothetical protein